MVWPFRRKSNRKSSQSGPQPLESESAMHKTGSIYPLQGRHNDNESVPERRRSRRDKKRKSSRESKKLQRDPRRAYSFSPGRNDSIRVTRLVDQDRPPVPPLPVGFKDKGNRAQTDHFGSSQGVEKPLRASTQPQEASQWERMPTLHKRSAQDMARRKSSKKRKEEHDREAEIKSMAAFMPTRPAAEPNSSGRSLKRDSKRMRSGLTSSQHKSSDISLPLAESIHSSLSGSETQTSFRLSAFDMLAPRPTIRYSETPRYGPGPHGFGSDRSDSKKRRASERIPEETLRAHKTIDDLADDLDAGELRELMERDQKRREKKKIAERIKAEKKVARRQEKQRADEATAAREGTPPPDNMERGVLGREVVGLGIGTSATFSSQEREGSVERESPRKKRPTEGLRQDSVASSTNNPFATFQRSASLATENITPTSEHSDPVIQVAKVGTVAKASMSPPASPRGHARGASSISQMMDLNKMEVEKPAQPEVPQKSKPESETSAKAPQSSWTSFFKRSSKNKRGSTPSSFSNTSRDSMHSAQVPQIGYTPMRSTSNIPKRTMSKFREDLPELPLSPPDSRMQSPEHQVPPPLQTEQLDSKAGRTSVDEPRVRYDTPTSGYRSIDAMRLMEETPTSGHRTVDSPEPAAILSQSLASIDSEGSWLSGRRGGSKRGSVQPSYPLRDSANSLQKKFKEYSESAEELGIAEDEYFSRLSPEPEEQNKVRRPSGAPMPSSDEEEGSIASPTPSAVEQGQTKWGAVPGRHPTVVHRQPAAKSREGLLNEYEDDSDNDSALRDSTNRLKGRGRGFNKSVVDEADSEVTLSRATSVDLGRGHVRRVSAGSARLLDVKPNRTSIDAKRISSG